MKPDILARGATVSDQLTVMRGITWLVLWDARYNHTAATVAEAGMYGPDRIVVRPEAVSAWYRSHEHAYGIGTPERWSPTWITIRGMPQVLTLARPNVFAEALSTAFAANQEAERW